MKLQLFYFSSLFLIRLILRSKGKTQILFRQIKNKKKLKFNFCSNVSGNLIVTISKVGMPLMQLDKQSQSLKLIDQVAISTNWFLF